MSFTQADLPDSEKEQLCQGLLDEFGVGRVQVNSKGEMIHGCLLPGGNHSDQKKNPTASLNYKKLTYNCFGCNQSGGLLWFIATMRGTSDTQARKWLSKETGTDGEVQELTRLLQLFDSMYQKESPPPIPRYSKDILTPWLQIHPYMTEVRGIPEETLMHFSVGYGVLPIGPRENPIMSHRIVLPHFWKGSLVGWQTRRLADDGTPKYHNSPDFPKDETIYNYDPKRDFAVMVESGMSTLKHHHAEPGIEGFFGASVTDLQMKLTTKHRQVVLFMDNGDAGWKSVLGSYSERGKQIRKGLGEALEPYCDVRVVFNPYVDYDAEGNRVWLDPADLRTETFLQLVEDAVPYSIWTPPTESDLVTYRREPVPAGV